MQERPECSTLDCPTVGVRSMPYSQKLDIAEKPSFYRGNEKSFITLTSGYRGCCGQDGLRERRKRCRRQQRRTGILFYPNDPDKNKLDRLTPIIN